MEHILRCNAMKCRKELNECAVVTTCSHIFCTNCADRLHLSKPPNGQRPTCPACEAQLINPDDAVLTNLNPAEDYKTSVLSGLSPTIIMECAGRALSFWAYQATQEVVYQEMMVTSLGTKYTSLSAQMDKIIHEANSEISDLRVKMNNLHIDQENLRQRNEELGQALREKCRKHTQTQELNDKPKSRGMLDQIQNAASDAVNHAIHTSAASHHFIDNSPKLNQQRQQSLLTNIQGNGALLPNQSAERLDTLSMPPPVARAGLSDIWNQYNVQEGKALNTGQPPSSHRQRLVSAGILGTGSRNLQMARTSSAPLSQRRAISGRPVLANFSRNDGGRYAFAGYGISAGAKVSHPQAVAYGIANGARCNIRSRVAQRPGSTTSMADRLVFNQASGLNALGQVNMYQ